MLRSPGPAIPLLVCQLAVLLFFITAKVYYGHWLGSPVAIKVAAVRRGSPDAEAVQAVQLSEFQREVTNMSTLPPHPNVLKLLGACMEAPNLALVTEWVLASGSFIIA